MPLSLRAVAASRGAAIRGARVMRAFLTHRRGVTSLEYGIVATFLCLSLLAIFRQFGSVLAAMFTSAASGL